MKKKLFYTVIALFIIYYFLFVKKYHYVYIKYDIRYADGDSYVQSYNSIAEIRREFEKYDPYNFDIAEFSERKDEMLEVIIKVDDNGKGESTFFYIYNNRDVFMFTGILGKIFNSQDLSFEEFSGATNLNKLYLSDRSCYDDYFPKKNRGNWLWIEDLSNMKNLDNLEYLEFGMFGTHKVDLNTITHLTSLKELIVYSSGTKTLEPIVQLEKLEILRISNFSNVRDITPLYELENLKYLYINGTGISKEDIETFKRERPDVIVYEGNIYKDNNGTITKTNVFFTILV